MGDRTVLMSAKPLDAGYRITWYTIKEVLGHGGFGITYLAYDNNLDRDVAIKEYLPTSFAHRYEDHSVKPISDDHTNQFAWGLDRFLKEAKNLAKFNHENIVSVYSVFEENHTAYMVMEYERGENLASLIARQGKLDEAFQKQVFFPILDGLEKIHQCGFIHRDIKPANIHVRENGSPVLIDFGAARQSSVQNKGDMTTLVTKGYTPLEQYSSNYGKQGPWTDIYSLATAIYEGITGSKPDDSISRSAQLLRSKPDRVQHLQIADYPDYSRSFLDAVNAGLALQPDDRPQSLTAWRTQFNNSSSATPASQQPQVHSAPPVVAKKKHVPPVSDMTLLDWEPENSSPIVQDDHWGGITSHDPQPTARRSRYSNIRRILQAGVMAVLALSIGIGTSVYVFNGSSAEASLNPSDRIALAVRPTGNDSDVVIEDAAPRTSTIFFNQPLLTDRASSAPRTFSQIIEGSPKFPPIVGLDESIWAQKTCNDCHSWRRESLCKQGEFYSARDDSQLSRIKHPFDGFFKNALKEWAHNGCQ